MLEEKAFLCADYNRNITSLPQRTEKRKKKVSLLCSFCCELTSALHTCNGPYAAVNKRTIVDLHQNMSLSNNRVSRQSILVFGVRFTCSNSMCCF